ncbi:MAG: high frequency lysogenization protein HflD [Gammaproteobacteria bacterium]|jgi:high frequency lysogenization protein|nr:high frequency lysogenization protein HflD [Gammaproteobacteria bacterium]MBT6042164.1 high frequency lysogenization protein HflD [Gammaproteobacteria bacterium]
MNIKLQQCLALSGVAQSAYLVKQLAQNGMVGQDKLNTLIRSLFISNPKTTEEVYGSVSRLNLGMQVLQEIVRNDEGSLKSPDVLRYFLGLMHLERKMMAKKGMLDLIGERLDAMEHLSLEDPDLGNNQLIQELSALYKDTLSTLPFRIQVTGEVKFLKNEEIADKIRAVLLSGIRSAVLWYQLEGRRWHLLIGRKKIDRNLLLLMNKVHEIH